VRIGILGGTFDPPHIGHILAASDAYEALQLDRVVFVPAAQQPFKAHLPNGPSDSAPLRASAPDRLEMVRLAIAQDQRFDVSAIEIERGGLSYTVETLSELAERSPDDKRFLLLGADVLALFAKWRQPERILQLATLAVFTRPSDEIGDARSVWLAASEQWKSLYGRLPERSPVFLDSRRIDVSSTEVRERVAHGRSIHGFVPEAVERFIATRDLYR
jgi:nicotinate-nucleotide adenylyltransferase